MNDKPADPLQLSYARPTRRWTPSRIGFLCGASLPVAVNLYACIALARGDPAHGLLPLLLIAVNLPAAPCICGLVDAALDDRSSELSAVVCSLVIATVISTPVWGFVGRFIGWLCEGTKWEQELRHPGEVESGKQA